ncbi:MAG: nucleotidyltransferase domain-containing protein, partial [Microthrixaceae bacterium]
MSRRSARVDKASEIEALAREHLCCAFPDLLALYLYGSFAGDEPWPSSDVDLGVLLAGGRSADPERLLEAAADLGARFNRDVDLVDLRAAGTDLS